MRHRFLAILALALIAQAAPADDWPAYRHDNARSGVTTESLAAARLVPAWTWESAAPPAPAWPGPAKWDAYASLRGLKSMRNYDSVLHPIAVGDAVYIASNVDDSVRCLDAATGRERWVFIAGGPIRVAPTFAGGRLLFGADDGFAYCIDADSGELIWRFSPTANVADRGVLNDGRLISFWPIRTGVAVADGTAYFGASFVPWKESYLCAVDADTGEPTGEGRFVRPLGLERTLEGAILTSHDSLIVPQGRVAPMIFARADGSPQGLLPGGGGSFCLLTEDNRVVHGPGNKGGWITDSDTTSRTQVASYDRGTALVVSGDVSYLLRPDGLGAINRKTQTPLWVAQCEYPHAMILAGETLYLGGDDAIAAFDAGTGKKIWIGRVRGRAQGLAVANGHLLVSTDEGQLVAFAEGATDRGLADERPTSPDLAPSPPIRGFNDRGLLARWVFQRNALTGEGIANKVANQVGGLPAESLGVPRFERTGEVEAIVLDGNHGGFEVAYDFHDANLPTRDITAEAWIRLDEGIDWGGIAGVQQDNGAYERGWILGFRGTRPAFAVVGQDGGDGFTWLTAPADFTAGGWHHIVGTYDGQTMRLYVDGKPAGESAAESGDINYPEAARYHLGAYRDDNEHYKIKGLLHEIRVYNRALSASEIARHHRGMASLFPEPAAPVLAEATDHPAIGPYLVFESPSTARVRWTTDRPCPTKLTFTKGGEPQELGDPRAKTEHEVLLEGLRPERVYAYRIHHADGSGLSPEYECDSSFNYTRDPVVTPISHVDADIDAALRAARGDQGLAVVLAPRDAQSLVSLAAHSRFNVLAFETDRDRVDAVRRELVGLGINGHRIAVAHTAGLDKLGTPDAFANIVLVGRPQALREPGVIAEIGRIVEPVGGVAVLDPAGISTDALAMTLEHGARHGERFTRTEQEGLVVFRKGPIEGAAGWTHMYGSPDNSGFAGEQLAGIDSTDDLEINWIGRPGPRYQSDRGNRKPSPLAANGRLYMQGLNRLICVDSYNGTILWALETPTLQRFNVPRDASNWVADDKHVYFAAAGHVWIIDGDTGEVVAQHPVHSPEGMRWTSDWGYLASLGDTLIGSAVKQGSSFTEWWGGDAWYDAKDGEHAKKVTSDSLFSINKVTGSKQWEYTGGLVVNPTITLMDDQMFFVETDDAGLMGGDARRVDGEKFWQSQKLVALDARTGEKLWEVEIDTLDGVSAFYLAGADGLLTIVASQGGEFGIYGFNAKTGEAVWQRELPWEVDHHGKHLSHQAIVGGRVVVRPYVLDLFTGEDLPFTFPAGHQCGTYTCSQSALFLRAGNLTVWSQEDNSSSSWNRLRPDCWISTIPANGMLLSPEGGGGCSCGSWMEVSMGLLPVRD